MALEVLGSIAALAAIGVGLVYAGGALAARATPLISTSVDRTIGEASQKQMALGQEECKNPAAQAYVEEIARPLLAKAGKLPFEFHFRVVDTDEVNAFALPGGFVTVNRGLLEAAESGEEVAGVLGHEIQHALLRHGTKRVLRELGGTVLISLILGGTDLHGVGQMAGQLTGLSYDRGQETEADERGVVLLVAAGVDPAGLSTFFARLSKDAIRPPELLSTHPDPGDRATLIKRYQLAGTFKKLPPPSSAPCDLATSPE
jgi:predicted Zn-dependent protease